jgi:hypothetical protein
MTLLLAYVLEVPDSYLLAYVLEVPDSYLLAYVWEVPNSYLLAYVWELPDSYLLAYVWEVPDSYLLAYVWEVPDSYLGWNADFTQIFRGVSQFLQVTCSLTSFPIHCQADISRSPMNENIFNKYNN